MPTYKIASYQQNNVFAMFGAPDGHLQGVTIPDAVLIQFDILMMSTTVLETCRGV
jgi:hypothetical protein